MKIVHDVLNIDIAFIAEVGSMFLKMIISWRALAGMVHRSTSSAEGKKEIKQGKSEMRVRVVEEVVDLLYLKKLYLVYADEMKITTGNYLCFQNHLYLVHAVLFFSK